MSELKSVKGKEIYDDIEYYARGFEPEEVDDKFKSLLSEEYYTKPEADKVIAEKDEQIAELKSDIADLRDDKKSTDAILDERNAEIRKLKAENRFVKERLEQQEKTFKWHKVEILFGKLTGDLPSRDLNRICGRDFLVHYTVKYGNCISDGIAYSDYDEDEGFYELEDNYTPVHWCEVPLPPLAVKFKEA